MFAHCTHNYVRLNIHAPKTRKEDQKKTFDAIRKLRKEIVNDNCTEKMQVN